jgi:hypothetical protein
MKRFFVLQLAFVACYVLCLSSCEPTESVATISQEVETKDREKAKEVSRLETAIVFEAGIYAIPFGGTTEEIVKWCADNNMAIANATEKDVKENARKALRIIRDLEEAYDFEMASLAPLEQELLKLAQGYADTGHVFELAKVAAAKEKLDVLKNPTVSYEGQNYYLQSVHKGMKVYVDNERKVCTDDTICKTAYGLTLTATENSEKMITNGLTRLDIFLYGDIGQELRTYATLAFFGSSLQRSANAQFDLVFTGICQKYGTPEFRSWGADFLTRTLLRHDVEHLLGIEFAFLHEGSNVAVPPDKAVWARNLLLFGGLVHEGESVLRLKGGEFALLYYDKDAAARIFELHSKATDDFEKQYHEKKKDALVQMQQDF